MVKSDKYIQMIKKEEILARNATRGPKGLG